MYILMLVVWSIALAANQISNKSKWSDIFANSTVTRDNWVHVGSATGLGCGIVVLLMCVYAMSCDNGSMTNRSPRISRLKRIAFDFSCNLASLCIVSVASIYLYVNRNTNKKTEIKGMPWAIVFGGMFLALSLIDSLVFKPTMSYLEFMSSPCVASAIKPQRVHDTTGELHRGMHFMQRYLQGIVPLMPYVGTLGSGDMEFAGMPVSSIVVGPDSNKSDGEGEWYASAARELIRHLSQMYSLGASGAPLGAVSDALPGFMGSEEIENPSSVRHVR